MINLYNKKDCTGCEACIQCCPKSCIGIKEDYEGFFYPKIDTNKCINCGLCEKVCPVINQGIERKPISVYAVKHKDKNIRLSSSSGGVFTAIAEQIINEGGIVFGVRFDKQWNVIHDYTESINDLHLFKGSKYVQSSIGNSYKNVESFLKSGRFVLFSGTPCQVSGLKRFLRKDYNNLLTIDFICHGVPSPGIWKEYLKEELNCYTNNDNKDNLSIKSISFRNKSLGWKKFSFNITIEENSKNKLSTHSESLHKNIFLRGFHSDLYLRPSCYSCPTKSLKSGSDITIADFWGIKKYYPDFDDDTGVSVLMLNTQKFDIKKISHFLDIRKSSYTDICSVNSALIHSPILPKNRDLFFSSSSMSIRERVLKFEKKPKGIIARIIYKITTILKSLL